MSIKEIREKILAWKQLNKLIIINKSSKEPLLFTIYLFISEGPITDWQDLIEKE